MDQHIVRIAHDINTMTSQCMTLYVYSLHNYIPRRKNLVARQPRKLQLGEASCIERRSRAQGYIYIKKAYFGRSKVSLNTEVSLFQGCPLGGVPLYMEL